MKLSEIREIAIAQKNRLESMDTGLERESLSQLPDLKTHALIVSGIRRCGKSTLLHQFIKRLGKAFFFLNFEDLRLSAFSIPDYALLDTAISESGAGLLFFDEIQSAPQWELYVRQKLDEGFKVIITGSNASLLSAELGTKLTGRHITKELFPFSYNEYLAFKGLAKGADSLNLYLETGGFPEYLKTGNEEILTQLQSDIIYRDIAVRYGIRDVQSLMRLFTILVSNAAHLVSPSKLAPTVGLKSPSTMLEYFSHLEASYLIQLVPRFAWSAKAQAVAPKKIYIMDSGIIKTGSVSFTQDRGALLENYVFLEFRRHTADIFYFSGQDSECDFIIKPHGGKAICVQVCLELTLDNEDREIRGLEAALEFFNLPTGFILTANTSDTIIRNGKTIQVLPSYAFDYSQLA
jgi:predicted AAA+ superfamily ATPase